MFLGRAALWVGLICLGVARAEEEVEPDCASAVYTTLSEVLFTDIQGADNETTMYDFCNSKFRVISALESVKEHCAEDELDDAVAYLAGDWCNPDTVNPPSLDLIADIPKSETEKWHRVVYEDRETFNFTEPVLISQGLYDAAYKTVVNWNNTHYVWYTYGWAFFMYFAIVFGIAFISRMTNFAVDRLRQSNVDVREKMPLWSRTSLVMKRFFITPALVGRRVAQPWGFAVVPPRIESLTITGFIILNIVLCGVYYPKTTPSLYFEVSGMEFWRYFADRTGVLATYNIPLIWMFAMRNNVVLWFTGWSYTTFGSFHRWVSRIATVEAILHSIGYTVIMFLEGGAPSFYSVWQYLYWQMGAVATSAMGLIWLFSLYPIKKHMFEAFLMLHIIFAAIFTAGIWYHLALTYDEFLYFIYPCIALWSFDRLLRIGRLAVLNRQFRGYATYNHDTNIVRLNVPIRSTIKPKAGSYYFIYVFHGVRLWENHPFSLSTWTQSSDPAVGNSVSFLMKPHKGATSRLKDLIVKRSGSGNENSESAVQLRVAVEGPYGPNHDFKRFSSVMLLAGGSGIPVALAHIQSLHEAMKSNGPIATRRIHLVWAVREEAFFDDVWNQELESYLALSSEPGSIELEVDIYITGSKKASSVEEKATPQLVTGSRLDISSASESEEGPSNEVSSKEVDSKEVGSGVMESKEVASSHEGDDIRNLPHNVTIYRERPDISSIVSTAAQKWNNKGERIALMSCGPSALVDQAREAVVDAYAEGVEAIEFFPEAFVW